MDTTTIIANIIITAIGGTAFGGIGTAIVVIMKNRSERKISELQATSKVKQEENTSAIVAWQQIHERDEKEKAELHRMYREDIAELKVEIKELRGEIKAVKESEKACGERQAAMETELKYLKETILPQLQANRSQPASG